MNPTIILILGIAAAEAHDPDFIIGTAVGQGALLLSYLIREWFKERDRRYQREQDEAARIRERAAQAQRLEDTKQTLVQKVEETQMQLANGVQSKLDATLRKFDDLPAQVAAQPTKLSEEAVNKVAEKIVEKLPNGSKP